jgi:hypothetical protein
MAEIRSEPKYLARKLKGRSSRPRQRWYENFIADFSHTGYAGVDWVYVA